MELVVGGAGKDDIDLHVESCMQGSLEVPGQLDSKRVFVVGTWMSH